MNIKTSLAGLLALCGLASAPVYAGPAAREAYDGSVLSAYIKGAYLESQGDFYDAYQYYLFAAARDSANPRIMLRLARIAAQVGDYEPAREYGERLLASGRYGTEALLILAEVEYRLGKSDRSLELLRDLRSREDVPLFDVLAFYARVAQEAGKRDEAIAALEEAAALPDADVSAWYDLGMLRVEAGRTDAAAEAFAKAIEMKPDHAAAHLALARLHEASGRRADPSA